MTEDYISLSIVIPVYRSQAILPSLLERIHDEIVNSDQISKLEVVLVNDASPDDSWQVICALAKTYPFVKGISLRKNFGQHNAIMAGLALSSGNIIVIMDDDLQHPPSSIPEMINALNQGFDVCYTHYINRQHPLWKKFGSLFNDIIASILLNKPRDIYLSSFKALRKELAGEVLKYDGPYPYLDGLILDATSAITSIEVKHHPRLHGPGNYNLSKSLSLWLRMATGFSVLPLRLASISGLILSAISLLMIIALIIQKLTYSQFPIGWASIISTILFIGGIQLFCIGLIGEYLARSYLKINHKPQFVIKECT